MVVEFFYLVETLGVPLEMVLDHLVAENMVPDWYGFWRNAREKNWNPRTIRAKLEAAIGDVYGPKYLREWEVKLDEFLEVTGWG